MVGDRHSSPGGSTSHRPSTPKTLRDRLSRILPSSSAARRRRPATQTHMTSSPLAPVQSGPPAPTGSTLHDFSFADSKMAAEFLHRSSASPAPLETQSDLGFVGDAQSQQQHHWWDVGTLSSRQRGARSTLSQSSSSASGGKDPTATTASSKSSTARRRMSSLVSLFRRGTQKSQSVPNLGAFDDGSSSVSLGSGSSGLKSSRTQKPGSPPVAATTSPPNSADCPPPLPPMRGRPSSSSSTSSSTDNQRQTTATADRSSGGGGGGGAGAKLTAMIKSTGGAMAGTLRGRRERSADATARGGGVGGGERINALSYTRTVYDEIPVQF